MLSYYFQNNKLRFATDKKCTPPPVKDETKELLPCNSLID